MRNEQNEIIRLITKAIYEKNFEEFQKLIANGFDVNTILNPSPPPMTDDDLQLFRLRIEEQIRQRIQDGIQQNLLPPQQAEAMFQQLITNAIDSYQKRNKNTGLTLLYITAQEGLVEFVEELLKRGAKINYDSLLNPILIAIEMDEINVVKKFLEFGENINKTNISGTTPLSMAVQHKRITIIDMLLETGADINKANNNGMTPFFWAITKENNSGVINKLLKKGANPNIKNRDGGSTPLLLVIQKNDLELIKILVAAGADVNQANIDGVTPLMMAANVKNHEAAMCLLKAGAKSDCKATVKGVSHDAINLALGNSFPSPPRNLKLAQDIASYTQNFHLLKKINHPIETVPNKFLCDLLDCVMDDPVFLTTVGQLMFFERRVIELAIDAKWIKNISKKELRPAQFLQQEIEDYIEARLHEKTTQLPEEKIHLGIRNKYGLFTELHNSYICEHRGEHPDIQHAYDKRYAIMLRN